MGGTVVLAHQSGTLQVQRYLRARYVGNRHVEQWLVALCDLQLGIQAGGQCQQR